MLIGDTVINRVRKVGVAALVVVFAGFSDRGCSGCRLDGSRQRGALRDDAAKELGLRRV